MTITKPNNNNEKPSVWKVCRDNLALIQWFVVLLFGALAISNTLGRFQTSQAAEIQSLQNGQDTIKTQIHDGAEARDKQIDELKKTVLTKDEFEAHWKQIDLLRQDNKDMRILMEKLLENQNRP